MTTNITRYFVRTRHMLPKATLRALPCIAIAFASANTHVGDEPGQPFVISRSAAVYDLEHPLSPDDLLDARNFKQNCARRYVTVEGWLCYVATPKSQGRVYDNLPQLEDDWDVHFGLIREIPSSQVVDHAYRTKHALTCEITPPARLARTSLLNAIKNGDASTYRHVRVKGYLRLGTESGHEGTRTYTLPGGGLMKSGHWEIHPVESVESIDDKPRLTLGPNAIYASPPAEDRYKLSWQTWQYSSSKTRGSNHGTLRGRVAAMRAAADHSGDVDVDLTGASGATAHVVIPVYYISGFDATKGVLQFKSGIPVSRIRRIQTGTTATFSGLRSWRVAAGDPNPHPVMQPVEKIE